MQRGVQCYGRQVAVLYLLSVPPAGSPSLAMQPAPPALQCTLPPVDVCSR